MTPTGTTPADKAAILVEALPYIRRFWGRTVVIKYGGNALAAADQGFDPLTSFATDIVLMQAVGMRPVVVHGGGPQIGELMNRLGMVPKFVDGLRVTDAETLDIARMVLVGKVNRDIVSAINVHGPLAVGVSGEDAGLISAEARHPDLGFVGDVAAINPDLLLRLISEDLIPVVATIGSDDTGQAYNINADTAAGALAAAIGATKLVYLTDVDGIRGDRDDPSTRLSGVTTAELAAMIDSGAVAGGMIPKVRSCVEAVEGGVASAHVIDGSAPHALLLEIFTHEGVGTMVVPT
ncbi:MAG: acetylglutamate kinase [Actinomycetota bacterium]|nr:acetylglutamate kinase [Actinomycetota bacterium]